MSYTSASHLISACGSEEDTDSKSFKSFEQLRGPVSCSTTKDGRVVVCEWRGHSVSIIKAGEIVTQFGNKDPNEPNEDSIKFRNVFRSPKKSSSQLHGSNTGELHEPTGVAVTEDNHIAVCDSLNNRIQLFNDTGIPVAIAQPPSLLQPYDIAIDRNGLMYVSNPLKHAISVFTTEMSFSHEIQVTRGKSTHKYFTPLGLSIDSQNMLYVCDRDDSCIKKLSIFGDPITIYKADHLAHPVRVAVDYNGTVYATYSYSKEIAMFSNNGQYIGRFGGDSDCVKTMKRPRGITIESDNIYICDTINNNVVIF